MCKLTLFDVSPEVYEANYELVRDLLILNEISGNPDGIGYNLFHKNTITKSPQLARNYFRSHLHDFKKNKSLNGIYHVRKSSVAFTQNNRDTIVKYEYTHPFVFDDIIVSHNGTLRDRTTHKEYSIISSLWDKDFIDSQKFAKSLSYYSRTSKDGIVTLDSINSAVNLFSGAFCFLIRDIKTKDTIWVVRGRDRELFELTISKKGKKLGIIINTGWNELLFINEKLLDYDIELGELRKETAYTYDVGSYQLNEVGKVEQDQTYYISGTTVRQTSNYGRSWENNDDGIYTETPKPTVKDNSKYKNLLDILLENELYFAEVIQLAILFNGKHFFTYDEENIKDFTKFLGYITKINSAKGRIKEWNELIHKSSISRLSLYNACKISFPYFLNSRGQLKHAQKELDKYLSDKENGVL